MPLFYCENYEKRLKSFKRDLLGGISADKRDLFGGKSDKNVDFLEGISHCIINV